MTKARLLTLWVAFATFAYVTASQDWFTLSMNPDGETTKLASYDGLTAYGNISAALMLNYAGILVLAFVGSLGRKITAGLIAILNAAFLVWLATRVFSQDISGLAKQVEQMTGIAAVHGIKNVSVATEGSAFWFMAAMALATVVSIAVLAFERKWPKRQSKTELPSQSSKDTEPKDSIGIWDSQRR